MTLAVRLKLDISSSALHKIIRYVLYTRQLEGNSHVLGRAYVVLDPSCS